MNLTTRGTAILALALAILGWAAGVFGLGLGVVSAPVLTLVLRETVSDLPVISLTLNALSCVVIVAVLAPARLISWKHAIGLSAVAGVVAPFAAWADRSVPSFITAYAYLAAVLFLVLHFLRPPRGHALPHINWTVLYFGAAPAGLVGGFTGIGPGFALMPGLVVAGMDVRHAAATAAAASIIPSLTALIPLPCGTAFSQFSPIALLPLGAALVGVAMGARYTFVQTVSLRWQRVFAGFVAVLAIAQFFSLG
ncbi:MAG TPA: TSUP family transporter [Opitutaceae bacterium]